MQSDSECSQHLISNSEYGVRIFRTMHISCSKINTHLRYGKFYFICKIKYKITQSTIFNINVTCGCVFVDICANSYTTIPVMCTVSFVRAQIQLWYCQLANLYSLLFTVNFRCKTKTKYSCSDLSLPRKCVHLQVIDIFISQIYLYKIEGYCNSLDPQIWIVIQ